MPTVAPDSEEASYLSSLEAELHIKEQEQVCSACCVCSHDLFTSFLEVH